MSREGERNLFSNEDGTPSKEFYWYIGGLQKYIPAAMALFVTLTRRAQLIHE